MARKDDEEEKEFEGKEGEVQIVTNEQLINLKLDKILELLEKQQEKQ